MKAIILAAGLGSRLRPITDNIPKCMVPVNGQPIINKQISNLLDNSFREDEIIVVGGYKAEVLEEYLITHFPTVKLIKNVRYSVTNNMYSLYLALKEIGDESFLLMNADVFYDSNVIAGLLSSEDDNAIAVDKSQYIEESMKVCVSEANNITHISKTISEDDHYAVSIDVYKMSKEGAKKLKKIVKEFIEIKKDENSWTEVALDQIFDSCMFKPFIIDGNWVEIDNNDDLKLAESIFK